MTSIYIVENIVEGIESDIADFKAELELVKTGEHSIAHIDLRCLGCAVERILCILTNPGMLGDE